MSYNELNFNSKFYFFYLSCNESFAFAFSYLHLILCTLMTGLKMCKLKVKNKNKNYKNLIKIKHWLDFIELKMKSILSLCCKLNAFHLANHYFFATLFYGDSKITVLGSNQFKKCYK